MGKKNKKLYVQPGQPSTYRFLDQRADSRLYGGGQLFQGEGGWPHGALVEVRRVAEAEGRVAGVELVRALEEADDLSVFIGVGGHPIPGPGREVGGAGFNDLMDAHGHGAIRFWHLGDFCQHGSFTLRPVLAEARFCLQLSSALLHRRPFLVRESLGGFAGRGSAPGGLLCGLAGGALFLIHERFLPLAGIRAPPGTLAATVAYMFYYTFRLAGKTTGLRRTIPKPFTTDRLQTELASHPHSLIH